MTNEVTTYNIIGLPNKRFITFLVVGGLNTLFGYSLFALFIFFHLHYTLAVLLSTVFGVLFNFKTTGKLVFGNADNRLLIKFVSVYSALYFVNVASLKLLSLLGMNLYQAGAMILLPMAVLAFFLNKKLVFKT